MTSRGLSFSRSLASLQGKILGCSAFECLPLFTNLSSSAALPLESGCKGTHFFLSRNFYAILFCKKFCGFFVNHCKQDGCRWIFFEASGNRWKRPYIMYFARARACVRIRTCRWKKRQVHVKQTGRDLRLHTEKNRLNTEKTGWTPKKNRLNTEIKQAEHWKEQIEHRKKNRVNIEKNRLKNRPPTKKNGRDTEKFIRTKDIFWKNGKKSRKERT